ncbi:trypsin-like serine protease [Microbispora sp. H13382]|uniref:trypsin-like serine protease n=1 Tax=Microbispora sp. H13382 TaxID=2729112 RepID=UPI0015FF2F2F|nr:trypsin-like serine protease [Microbispora sp. H13382]
MSLKSKVTGAILAAAAVTAVATPAVATPAVATPAVPAGQAAPAPGNRAPAYLTPEQQDVFRRQAPLVAAADEIRKAVESGPSAGYAGIELAGDRVVVWWKDKVPGRVRAAIGRAGKAVTVEVRPAEYSQSELSEAADRLWAASGADHGGRVHAVKLALDGSGLTAAVREQDAALARQELPKVGVPVEMVAQEPMTLNKTRCDDDAPWYGGAAIRNATIGTGGPCGGTSGPGYHCTAAFAVHINLVRYLLTAGHCGAPGDRFTDAAGQTIGTAEAEHVGHDLLLIRVTGVVSVNDATGWIWDGKPGVNDFVKPVAGWGWTYKGQSLCVSGATSGATCGHVVDGKYTEICGEDVYGNNECHDDLISAKRPLGSTVGGDSGGPVFELTGDSSMVRAMGSHTGTIRTTSIFGSKNEWTLFQDFGTATRDFPGLEPYLGFAKDPL